MKNSLGFEIEPEELFCLKCKKPINPMEFEVYDGHCANCYKQWCKDWKKALRKMK